jgi:hypothetical protein
VAPTADDTKQTLLRNISRKLDRLIFLFHDLSLLETDMAGELDDLKAKVAGNTTVIGSAVELLHGLKTKLDEAIANNDMGAVKALSDQLGQDDQKLADAIAANTPTNPVPPAPPTPTTGPAPSPQATTHASTGGKAKHSP